ncbi:hypothetical protein Br6_04899 [Rhodococcus sp. Br-6]|nr:hypothetical protein Br6_04899 [Rhodococcus sp. Br-6]
MGSIGTVLGFLPDLITTGSSTMWDIFVEGSFTMLTGFTPPAPE